MSQVIVTVRRADEAAGRDLEVPAEVDAATLAGLIASALQWNTMVPYQIEVPALDLVLQGTESLAQAGVWDGALLVLRPEGPAVRAAGAGQPRGPQPGGGYAWKPVSD